MLLFWFRAVKVGGNLITIPGTVWCVGGAIILALLGTILFHEQITTKQIIGISLGIISLVLTTS